MLLVVIIILRFISRLRFPTDETKFVISLASDTRSITGKEL